MRLYLKGTPAGTRINKLRCVRDALRVIDPKATAHEAFTLLERLRDDGYALMANGDPLVLSEAAAVIERGGGLAVAVSEGTAAEQERRWRSKRATSDSATPEEVFATEAPGEPPQPTRAAEFSPAATATALACMAICGGNPISAALHAATLGRTTGDAVVYHETIQYLGGVFPWIVETVKASGMWPE